MKVIKFQRPTRGFGGEGVLSVEINGKVLVSQCRASMLDVDHPAAIDSVVRRMWKEMMAAIEKELKESITG